MKTHLGCQNKSTRKCPDLRGKFREFDPVDSRHKGIPGFRQDVLSRASVILVGAGGLCGEIAEGLVRKGAGKLIVCDGDIVEPSNLNRQLFLARDISKNKATQLAKNLCPMGSMGTEIISFPLFFQEAVEKGEV